MTDSMGGVVPLGPGLELEYEDEEAFLMALLRHIEGRLEAGEAEIVVNLTGVLSLPDTFLDALESAALATEGTGARLSFLCSPELADTFRAAGKSGSIPHEVRTPEVEELPLVAASGCFEITGGTLAARAPDESAMIQEFSQSFDRLAEQQPEVTVDLRNLPYLSASFCKALVLSALQARELGKPLKLKTTLEQDRVLRKVPGSEFFNLGKESDSQRMRRPQVEEAKVQAAASRIQEAMKTVARKPAAKKSERRSTLRLRISNAFVLYRNQENAKYPRIKTRLVDISRGGLAFFSSNPFDAGTSLPIYLQLPDFLSPARVVGKVVRCEPVTLANAAAAFRIGVQFAERSEEVDTGVRKLEKKRSKASK